MGPPTVQGGPWRRITAGRDGRACRRAPRGVTLIELLVALVLVSILLGSTIGMLGTLSRAVEQATRRWDRSEAMRTVWVTTERELRPGIPGRDWMVSPAGVLELRAFRGFARVCGPAVEPGVYPVAWRGDRLPAPDRDSLLVLGMDGGWRTGALVQWSEASSGSGGCGVDPGERTGWMRWTGAGSELPVLVRLFERGAYSFHAGAFRYARSGTPRQPLTPELFESETRYLAVDEVVLAELRFGRFPTGADAGARSALRFRFPEADL